ncbi:autophagy-related protein 13b [Malania oleifera]|uniref:autophagy-related protein 13b n=1 Tax=Malania oleifera TaxID=397392 RepID=UPI0025AEC04A|nr:autophagy-related protein 13b [Malania oleifera]XP_057974671.1 autophagy-related protein 13b [Malania oleifera]
MASSHGSTHSDAARMEQIITEFFAKSLQIILESRSPFVSSRNYSGDQVTSSPSSSTSSSSSVRPRDKWFNLALRDCPAALENIDFWRHSNLEPMVVDVILVQRPFDWDPMICSPRMGLARNTSLKECLPNCWNSEQEEFGCEERSKKIIERWIVQYENRKSRDGSSGSRRSSVLQTLYKKSILLLRSLYLTVRLLPAYKLFRDLNSSGQIHTFTLAPRVSSFVEPFTRREDSEMQRFGFTPVDTSCGRLCLSVMYCSSLSDVSSEPSTPMTPRFIPDYVGSPIADPIKRFPSLPVMGSPSSPFWRPHSWSDDLFKASPASAGSLLPSPTHSESRSLVSNPSSRRFPPMSMPVHPPETSIVHNKNTSFDEYWPSPTFSPSTSPSPPIYIPGSHPSNAILRSESAPVRIPSAKLVNSPLLSNKQILPQSPPLKGSRLGSSKTDKHTSSTQTGATLEKFFFIGKDESGKFSGVKTSCNSSPRISVSRSSSRLSLQDDLDDSEFACPFIVDDDDMTDTSSRPESFDQRGHLCEQIEPGGSFPVRKSQHAAVGALVRMLKKAPPLCQGFSNSNLSQASKPEFWCESIQEFNQISKEPAVRHATSSVISSGFVMSKTTADALEELRGYREMKDLLLVKSGGSQTG